MTQVDLHKKIDDFIRAGVDAASIELAKELTSFNEDAGRYFYSEVDSGWLKWLWDNGFLDTLKMPTGDDKKWVGYIPELNFLARVAEQSPKVVTEILLSIPISKQTLNPEVISRFIWIINLLPHEEMARALPKVLREDWMNLMADSRLSACEFKRAVEKISEKKDFLSLNVLLQILLTLRDHSTDASEPSYTDDDHVFALKDISDSEIFTWITSEENDHLEESLSILIEVLKKIVTLQNPIKEEVFEISEPFFIRDSDLFAIQLDEKKRIYSRSDLKNLIAATKLSIERLIKNSIDDANRVRSLYDKYVASLPDSYTLWRFKLFTVSRLPSIFKKELKDQLFRLFRVGERYFEIEGGAEYHQFLRTSFHALNENDQREYIEEVFKYFGADLDDKDKEKWRHRDGLEKLDYITDKMTEDELRKAETVFGERPVLGRHIPEPSIGEMRSGFIQPKAHINLSNFTIDEIVEHLKSDWSPKILNDQFKGDDFLAPRGAEGMGDALRGDFKVRMQDYFSNITKFFDREFIDPSYLNSLLRQADEMLRNKHEFTEDQNTFLLNLFDLLKASGESEGFVSFKDRWLADWITVHKTSADILLATLQNSKDSDWFKKYRIRILNIIKYLLSIQCNPSPDENTAEPYGVAINSVRGQAYISFVQFTFNDGKVLSDDVKELFVEILETDVSNAVRFLVGHYLATFYFRDKIFVRNLFPKIFPKEIAGGSEQFFSSWEGYLANTLYGNLFDELREYYQYAIQLNPESYTDRKYLKGLDETLAVHLALEFAHFDIGIDDPLLTLFWEVPNEERHFEFVSFIGRSCITRGEAGNEWLRENHVSKEKLVGLWDWLLATELPIESKVYSAFGFWINPEKEILDRMVVAKNIALSLKKSGGALDWDYGLLKQLEALARVSQADTLQIIRNLLLVGEELNLNRRSYFGNNDEIKTALQIIYQDNSLKEGVESLINTLIKKGSSVFWDLKEVLLRKEA